MDTFGVTILFIAIATMVAAFIRRVTRDKCLKDFEKNMVTLEFVSGKTVWGTVNVENTGLEFVYDEPHPDEQGHNETTFLLFKNEFANIQALARFHDQLSELDRKLRDRDLERTYHPRLLKRTARKTINVFRTIRDSVVEVVNILIAQAKKSTPAGTVLTQQDKYVSQMKQEIIGAPGASYEPLLEKYIGRKVVMEMVKAEQTVEYLGVLREYSADFIEIMDVKYKVREDDTPEMADIIVPRKLAVVRHLAE